MRGGIYCGDRRCGLKVGKEGCPDHPGRFRAKFGGSQKSFDSYSKAEGWLWHVRYQSTDGEYDRRDWMKDSPLTFANQMMAYLEVREREGSIKPKQLKAFRRWGKQAIGAMGHMNVKDIGFVEIQAHLLNLTVGMRTKAHVKSFLHTFWEWLIDCGTIKREQKPKFPRIEFKLGYRKIVDKETQQRILDRVKENEQDRDPKIWLGCDMLATYISMRPGELTKAREKDFNLGAGLLFIPDPKEKEGKIIPLLPEHVEILKTFPTAVDPEMCFFRHPRDYGATKAGTHYGPQIFYNAWKKACRDLGIEGLDLYGGTRHSTATALRKFRSPEEVRKASMHSTNRAFERYFQLQAEDLRNIYADTRYKNEGGTEVEPGFGASPKAKVFDFNGVTPPKCGRASRKP